MYIGNHCVLFGGRIASETDTILSGLAAGGCDGVELGSRFFGDEKALELKAALEQNHLLLSALHISSSFTELLDHPETVAETITRAVRFLQVMPEKNIMFTGLPVALGSGGNYDRPDDVRLTDPDSMKCVAERLNQMAESAMEQGITLHYHNHNWEFFHDALIYRMLVEYAPSMHLGMDLGWIAAGGYDPEELLRTYAKRVKYVHLRDYSKEKLAACRSFADLQSSAFVDMGEGSMNYELLLPLVEKTIGENGWATIEYEKGEVSFTRYHKATAYVRNLCK